MFCMLKKKKLCPAYVWKLTNSNGEKQVILLIILNGEGFHYIVVSVLLRGITSKQYHFYCLNLPSFFRNRKQAWVS